MLIFFLIAWARAQCTRDSYTGLPAAPPFPTTSYGNIASPYVQDHWSQIATMMRPENTVSNTQSNCPHLQSGLVDWHNPTTWGGVVPANGADVTIPSGSKVLLSSCSVPSNYVFGYITVPAGSALIFGDANIAFAAKGITVNGDFQIGSPTCRIRNNINITLYGSKAAQAWPPNPNVKGIYVLGGTIDMHSVEYFPTWTRLAKTANIGDNVIFIQDCPNWKAGQSIAITTTELKDSRDWHRNEERVVVSVKTTNVPRVCAVTVDTPLSYKHYGGSEYQAEVLLLSRNILVQGDASSEPTDNSPIACTHPSQPASTYPCQNTFLTGFGAHVMVATGSTLGRFSGVEMYRAGQTNVLGRYPLHFHMIGNITTPKSFYITDSSVHHSFFRCYTIHGTSGAGSLDNGVILTKNTGYDVIGHCFFASEDGVEENNTISYNAAAHIHILGPYWQTSYGVSEGANVKANGGSFWSQYSDWVTADSSLILADDIAASPFYFTNSYNSIYGNAASGGWAGFAFPNLVAPVGPDYTRTYFVPKNRPLLRFESNSAHSTGFWQGHAAGIYLGGNLLTDPSTPPTISTTGTKYTSGRDLPARDTCLDSRYGSPYISGGCPSELQVWMQFVNIKVFLANVGLQSWGDREEILGAEFHDVALSTNVFGRVWIDRMLVNCRSNNIPTFLSGCNSSIWNCNARDRQWFQSFGGFQFYDTGQSHIVTNSIFTNCRKTNNPSCAGNTCSGVQIWQYLTHSDQFTPGLMQQTKNITYVNVESDIIMAPSTSQSLITVSGRNQNWYDADGSVFGYFKGTRTNIGSNWTGEWWKFNDNCVLGTNTWTCPMIHPKDSTASLLMHWDRSKESQVGTTYCGNGNSLPCPLGIRVTHFGRKEGVGSFDVAVMPRITGPLIGTSGAWFVRYINGAPSTISFTDVQCRKEDVLHLAIPYPRGTTFSIYAQAPTWCTPGGTNPWNPICTHNFRSVNSVQAVRDAWGDTYFYDTNTQLLHLRIVEMDSFGWAFATVGTQAENVNWTSTSTSVSYFSRGGMDLLDTGSQFWEVFVKATSSNCNPSCPTLQSVSVPGELFPGTNPSPPTSGSSSPSSGSPSPSSGSPVAPSDPNDPESPNYVDPNATSSGLSGGQAAGVAIGVIVAVALIVAIISAVVYLKYIDSSERI